MKNFSFIALLLTALGAQIGFSHYVAGKWVSMCEPAFKVRPAPLCLQAHP